MAHYAFLNEENVVTEVIVGIDETQLIDGVIPEKFYSEIKNQKCVRTSYNAKIRKNFAGIGFTYDKTRDAFISPKCHDIAVLDESTCRWVCEDAGHK